MNVHVMCVAHMDIKTFKNALFIKLFLILVN